jgi:hypothetical protein
VPAAYSAPYLVVANYQCPSRRQCYEQSQSDQKRQSGYQEYRGECRNLAGTIKKSRSRIKTELAEIEGQFDAQKAELEEVSIRATSSNIHVSLCGVFWQPYWQTSNGYIEKATERLG